MKPLSILCLRTYRFSTSIYFSPLVNHPLRATKKYSTMETVKQTIAQNLGGDSHKLVPEDQQFSLEQIPSLKGKVALVTGGSEGIGYGCTHSILSHGIEKLFILSVSKDTVDGAVSAIQKELGDEVARKVTWLQCDLSDWKQTLETAKKITNNTDRLDIVINNAARGIMTYQLTEYGVDRHVCLQEIPVLLLILIANRAPLDGRESYRTCNLDIVPSAPTQKKCHFLHRTHRQHGVQPSHIHTIINQICVSRRTQPRSGSQCPIRSV